MSLTEERAAKIQDCIDTLKSSALILAGDWALGSLYDLEIKEICAVAKRITDKAVEKFKGQRKG